MNHTTETEVRRIDRQPAAHPAADAIRPLTAQKAKAGKDDDHAHPAGIAAVAAQFVFAAVLLTTGILSIRTDVPFGVLMFAASAISVLIGVRVLKTPEAPMEPANESLSALLKATRR